MKIHLLNYEKYAIDYLDGTLAAELKPDMEKFLAQHPYIKAELELMAGTTWPELPALDYGNKEELYRKMHFRWITSFRSIAATVFILLTAGLFYYFLSTPAPNTAPPLAEYTPSENPGATNDTQQALTPQEVSPVAKLEPATIKKTNFKPPIRLHKNENTDIAAPLSSAPAISLPDHLSTTDISVNPPTTPPLAENLSSINQPVFTSELPRLPRHEFSAIIGLSAQPTAVALVPAKSVPADITDNFTPEAYSGISQGSSLREAFLPEVLAGLFSKHK